MKVVHVGTIDEGGAYNAMVRIHNSMQQQGVESNIFLRNKKASNNEGISCNSGVKSIFSKAKNFYNNIFSNVAMHMDILGTDISKHEIIKDADVIILHWVNSFLSLKSLAKLKKLKKPIIWVLHDMWPLTGGCHCNKGCEKYLIGCTNCSYKNKNVSLKMIKKIVKEKKQLYKDLNVIFIAPSRWMEKCVHLSWITEGRTVFCIHNPIDCVSYQKLHERNKIFHHHKQIENRRIILFGAFNAISNKDKGFEYLQQALVYIKREDCVLVIFGNSEKDNIEKSIGSVNICLMGTIHDRNTLIQLYKSADVFVTPSVHDNYSNTVLESLCCGTPVVAFDVGGMSDLIEHKKNGYLSEFSNVVELADGIEYCIEHYEEMTEYAKMKVVNENSYEIVGNQYKALCKQLIETSDYE